MNEDMYQQDAAGWGFTALLCCIPVPGGQVLPGMFVLQKADFQSAVAQAYCKGTCEAGTRVISDIAALDLQTNKENLHLIATLCTLTSASSPSSGLEIN